MTKSLLLALFITIFLYGPRFTTAFTISPLNRRFSFQYRQSLLKNRVLFSANNQNTEQSASTSPTTAATSSAVTTSPEQPVETEEQKLRREKLEEIEDLKAREVFVTRDTGRYECQSCGYVYDTAKGYPEKGIAPGTPWDEIERLRCPQCGAKKNYFVSETETLSGFKENLKYGLGTNALTGGQKNLLIFGGLFVTFILFMSGYLLE